LGLAAVEKTVMASRLCLAGRNLTHLGGETSLPLQMAWAYDGNMLPILKPGLFGDG
jgi:hypothetical protein